MLGEIARSGKELGNFVYIREDSQNFTEEIAGALNQAFELAPGANSLNARIYVDTEAGYEMKTRLNPDENKIFNAKVVLPLEALKSEQALKIEFDFATIEMSKIEKMPDSKQDLLDNSLYFFNIHIFELTIKAQSDISKETITQYIEELKVIDAELNTTYQNALSIKFKEERRKIIEPIQEIKQKVVNLLQFLRQKQLGHHMTNDFIANLNAMAYSGARGNHLQKKLDNRALKNEERFTEIKAELEEYVKKLDMDKIRHDNKDIPDMVGDCFLTTKDVFECMEDQDCLCICLDISRSQAAIADPTKLVIKKIIPNYLSADAFIDAAKFALSNNPEAHGGYNKKAENAQILVGVGRENITGVLPLLLFNEHFSIARKKMPQILGLMCT